MKKLIATIIIIIILSITLLFVQAKYIEPKSLVVHEYTIVDSTIPESFYGFKIVQISDINYGTTIKKEQLDNIVNKINLIKPDIVVLTGDLLNSNITYNDTLKQELIESLSNINVSTGKYIIKGDNDYNYEFYEDIINNSGFNDLNDNYDLIYYQSNNPILISGISSDNKTIEEKTSNITSFLTSYNDENLYKILLVHNPDTIDYMNYNDFNLILAGHTMGGYINLPIIRDLANGQIKYYKSFYKLNNTSLYVSNGLGTEDNQYRLFNKPSINLFRLKNK